MTITTVDLTDAQKRKWIETRSAILWKCPAFTHILFSMLTPKGNDMGALFTTDIPIAATDGSTLMLNPERFFDFKLEERVFIVAHEILHAILNHCVVTLPMKRAGQVKYADGLALTYDAKTMNVAMDLVINDTLIHDRIGKFPKCGIHDPKIATRDDSFLDAYRKIWEQNGGPAGGSMGDGDGNGPGSGFDQVKDPGTSQGKDPGQAAQERSDAAWNTAVAAAIASAKMQGKLPAGLERLLSEVIEPTVAWQEHIRALFARRIGTGGYDWRRPDKRFIQRDIFIPRRSGNGCDAVAVAIDTSGSIGQKELDVFFGEMRGIIDDVKPAMIYLIWCDAKVHKVEELHDAMDLEGLKPHGGGGTDFRPVFAWLDDEGITPDALVYLTDGYGSFPDDAPSYPVIWGDITNRPDAYPFGDVVHVEIK